jgi:molecular chaperone DnaK (HSP70)
MAYILGIDLGTTYCCAAICKNNEIVIIPDKHGYRTIPSTISFTENEILIGNNSKNNSHCKNIIYDIKRLIGKKFDNKEIQKDIKYLLYDIIPNNDNNPLIFIKQFMGNEKKYTPEELSSFLLLHIKEYCEHYLGEKIINAVITVPAYFNNSQREMTKLAGELAGLNIMKIINEPTAAALAYGLHILEEKNIMIFDFGGGTIDISILKIENGLFEVKYTNGNNHLGGEDFNNAIFYYCLSEFIKKNKLNNDDVENILKNNKIKRKLKIESENAKKILSLQQNVKILIEVFYNDIDLDISLSRVKFENICDEHFQKCRDLINITMDDINKINILTLNDIILIGGSTKIPKISNILEEICKIKPKNDINPDEAVAYGAAMQGEILKSQIKNSICRDVVLVDITPFSIGIETVGGVMTKIINRHTSIPCTQEYIFSTFSDNQPSCIIKLYEGERHYTHDNNFLEQFELCNIPLMQRGLPQIIVKLKIDSNSILYITAIEKITNTNINVKIGNVKNKNNDEIDKLLSNYDNYKEYDTALSKYDKEKLKLLNLLSELKKFKYDLYFNENNNNANKKTEMINYITDIIKHGTIWFNYTDTYNNNNTNLCHMTQIYDKMYHNITNNIENKLKEYNIKK